MFLGNLIKSKKVGYKNIPIKGISFDSRTVKKDYIFFAIQGKKTSGIKFINKAIKRGAAAIVIEKKNIYIKSTIPVLKVSNVRKKLAEICSNFYKKKPNNIIAVTGTNGKTSVADFFYQILSLNKVNGASIGTLGLRSKFYNKKTTLTSIDALSLHKNLEILKKKKVNNVVIEASSHGLDQKRLDHLNINTGIFTNLSHDHLDYHKDIKSYLNAKMYLFRNLVNPKANIITDEENKEFKIIKKIIKKRNLKKNTIGKSYDSIVILSNIYKKNKQLVKIKIRSKIFTIKVPLIGFFQIKNLLMAVLAAHVSGLSFEKIFKKIDKIKSVPGRLEHIKTLSNNSNIIVDFAHTPDALEKSLVNLQEQFKQKILLVFGCGGERDKKKRFKMGKIASRFCRKIFVTDDNPRSENPSKIRASIMKGCKNIGTNIANREKAIETAIKELRPNEILLVAGKGHEETQTYANNIFNFSDKKIIKKIINNKKINLNFYNYKNELLNKINPQTEIKNISYNGVSINTKNIKKNNLFFAIKGKKTDGHNFLKKALDNGAVKLIVSRKIKNIPNNKVIKVKNTFLSLNKLGRFTRDLSPAQIIGVTGSAGKTTLKNLIGFSLKKYGKVYCSPHSYNNKFGVPLSLSNLQKNTEYGVFEVGMDKKGEIHKLSKMIKPKIAVITNIAEAHFKNFNKLKDIAKAKSEIINNISDRGNIILNRDDKFFSFLSSIAKRKKIIITSFGIKKKSDISLLKILRKKNYYKLKIKVKNNYFYFNVKNSTNSFIYNILSCVAVLSTLNLNLEKIRNQFINFSIPEGRGDIQIVKKFKKKFKFIDESYNANPLSMKMAIENLSYLKKINKEKKIVFLGDMLELGNKSKKFHVKLSNVINKSDIDKVFVYGKYIKQTFSRLSKDKKGKVFNNLNEAYIYFCKNLHNNDLLMVKGSNATGLSQFSKNIKKRQTSVI